MDINVSGNRVYQIDVTDLEDYGFRVNLVPTMVNLDGVGDPTPAMDAMANALREYFLTIITEPYTNSVVRYDAASGTEIEEP